MKIDRVYNRFHPDNGRHSYVYEFKGGVRVELFDIDLEAANIDSPTDLDAVEKHLASKTKFNMGDVVVLKNPEIYPMKEGRVILPGETHTRVEFDTPYDTGTMYFMNEDLELAQSRPSLHKLFSSNYYIPAFKEARKAEVIHHAPYFTGCNHEFKQYVGLNEIFDYCIHCDTKRQ